MKNQKIHQPLSIIQNYFITGLLLFCSITFTNAQAFITTWDTSYPGVGTNGSSIKIPASPYSNYDVDWDDDGVFDEFGIVGPKVHDFGTPGIYTIRIQGDLKSMEFDNGGSKRKLISIDQWGNIAWQSMYWSYFGCENLNILASDTPDLSSVTDMTYMFRDCAKLNADLNVWDVSNVANFTGTFQGCTIFNGDISSWDVSSGSFFSGMFKEASAFNQNIGGWDLGNSSKMMNEMFWDAASFNQDINAWDVSKATRMEHMFDGASSFNQDLDMWDVSMVEAFSYMFANTDAFNGNIDNWQIYSSNSIGRMFYNALAFNRDISSWYVSNIVYSDNVFNGAISFNQNINSWQWFSTTNLSGMFQGATAFNQPLYSWDLSNITDITRMFEDAISFNQDLSAWDVSTVSYRVNTFKNATAFNQNLGMWDLSNATNLSGFLNNCGMDITHYDSTIIGWSSQNVDNISMSAVGLKFCLSEDERSSLINDHNWSFAGDSKDCSDYSFMTTWKTDNPGTSASTELTIPTFAGETYSYDVDWESDGVIDDVGVTGDITHDYGVAGTYTISITGIFPRIYFNDGGDKEKILSIEEWGGNKWSSMANAFYGAINLVANAVDKPDLSMVTDMSYMFRNATNLAGDFSDWDVSNVSNMEGLFSFTNYNGDLSIWDVSQVTNTVNMFRNNPAFDGDLSLWDMGMVLDISHMFNSATSFTGASVANWDVSSVTNMFRTFRNASSFDVSLENWMLGPVTDMTGMLNNTNMSVENYDNTLIAWSALGINGITLGAYNLDYCNGEAARNDLITNNGWTFVGDNLDCSQTCGNIIWNGNVNNQWNLPLNWNKNRLPWPCDTVFIAPGSMINIMGPNAHCNKLINSGILNIKSTLIIHN